MKPFQCIALILFLGIGECLARDFLHHLLKTHKLHEIPELSKTNMGADNIYIDRNWKNEAEFSMSFQVYQHGGPKGQSEIFPIEMGGQGPEVKFATSEEGKEEFLKPKPGIAASEEEGEEGPFGGGGTAASEEPEE